MQNHDLDPRPLFTRPLCLALAAMALGSASARADVLFNTDIVNTTGSVANDYHVRLVAEEPINIDHTYEAGGDVSFLPGVVEGNGTKDVTINWEGVTVNQGQMVHVGASSGFGNGTPNKMRVAESWWTLGGVKLAALTSGRQASADFDGQAGTGEWLVGRIDLYDSATGFNQIGRQWVEGRGLGISLANLTTDGPIFARLALRAPTLQPVPLAELNPSLGGFGPAGPMQILEPVSPSPYCPGLPNSVQPNGAILEAIGGYGTSTALLRVSGAPNQPGILFSGPNPVQVPFGCGMLCVGGGGLVRYGPFFASGNQVERVIDMSLSQNARLQFWYRDPAFLPNCGNAFNLSNAIGL